MVDNITKITFISRFFQSSLFPESLSLKKLIQQELVRVIGLYREQHPEVNKVNNWGQIISTLDKKIILCYPQNLTFYLVYRCAIAFPLSTALNQSPVIVANHLVSLLSQTNPKIEQRGIKINVTVVDSGWLDFTIYEHSIIQNGLSCNLDLWLNQIAFNLVKYGTKYTSSYYLKKSKKIDNLFSLQYIYGRCFSLLNLAAREKIVILRSDKDSTLEWSLDRPEILFRTGNEGNNYVLGQEEYNLIWHICWMLDLLASDLTVSLQEETVLSSQLSLAWLRFVAKCNFCRSISGMEREKAIAQVGLIALTQWCIGAICLEKFALVLQKEI